MKNKIEIYERVIEDLNNQIELCNQYKTEIQDTIQELKRRYESGLIDERTYIETINEYLEGKSSEDWCSMYDTHIDDCDNKIRYYDKRINDIKNQLIYKKN